MTSGRWRKIEQIYSGALELDASLRGEFVARECGSDQKLRLEIEALLAVDASAPDAILNQPVMRAGAPDAVDETATSFGPGSRMGPYEIGELLGAGGMGRVFRALDTRLGRKVALKIFNTRFSDRGEREARAIASLNHPHVCTIYEAGWNYLAMELLEGETLAARLKRGRLRLNELLRIGTQVADALAAAHAQGLIHRDLKPANIMLTKAGVKVLDFGLAKFVNQPGETITEYGMVMGTPGYMAPEQMEGRACDRRTDIYALGLILGQMAPEDTSLQPPAFAHIVERCIARDPDDRWQSARDIKAELEWTLAAPAPKAPGMNGARKRGTAIFLAAGAAAVMLFAAWKLFHHSDPPQVARLAIALPDEGFATDPGNLAGPATISPDGQTVLIQLGLGARQTLWKRRLDSNQFERLAGTEGARQPFWSPDGKQFAFFASGTLQRMNANGGAAQVICKVRSVDSRGGAWAPDGTILFGVNFNGLMRVSSRGEDPVQLVALNERLGENSLRFPQFLPDGKRFIYYARTKDPANHGIYLDSLNGAGRKPRRKLAIADGPALVGHDPFSGRDYLVYPNDGHVWTQAFDLDSERLNPERVAISDDIGPFSLSRTGTLVFRLASANSAVLTWVGRNGQATSPAGQPGDFWDLRISPDQRKAAVLNHSTSSGAFWIEILDFERNLSTAFSDPGLQSSGLVWARDSKRLYFASWSGLVTEQPVPRWIFEKAIDTTGRGNLLSESQYRFVPHDLSPDGATLAGDYEVTKGPRQLLSALILTRLNPIRWEESVRTAQINTLPQFSPDGRWIAYQSDTSGRSEIYITGFPGGRSARQVSLAGGAQPRWSADGKELFYLDPDSNVWSAGTLAALSAATERPAKLFSFSIPRASQNFAYDVSRDGQRFLVVNGKQAAASQELRIIFNWPQLVSEAKGS